MLQLFREDAARWLVPSAVGDAGAITMATACRLLFRHAPLRATTWYRIGEWSRGRVPLVFGYTLRRLRRVHGLELSCEGQIGGGLYVAHTVGTVVMARAIGRNVSIIAAVTVGARKTLNFPSLGDGVFVGAGARVLGNISIGEGASIGANAVVLADVPAHATAVGIPARIVGVASHDDVAMTAPATTQPAVV